MVFFQLNRVLKCNRLVVQIILDECELINKIIDKIDIVQSNKQALKSISYFSFENGYLRKAERRGDYEIKKNCYNLYLY